MVSLLLWYKDSVAYIWLCSLHPHDLFWFLFLFSHLQNQILQILKSISWINTVKFTHTATSIKQLHVLKGHIFLVLSLKISCELNFRYWLSSLGTSVSSRKILFKLFGFPIFWHWAYWWRFIQETCPVHYIIYMYSQTYRNGHLLITVTFVLSRCILLYILIRYSGHHF